MQNEGYVFFFLDFFFFFFSRNTKPIEYYSVAAIRAVFNLIRRIRRVHVGGDERINMPGINQSGDRSPYFSWRNSVFEFLSRPGRIQANTKYSPGKKGHLHSAYIRGRSIRRMPPSPLSREQKLVFCEKFMLIDGVRLTTVHFSPPFPLGAR